MSKWFGVFCGVWIRLINLHLLLLVKLDKSNALAWIWCLSNALGLRASGIGRIKNSVRMHWICLISLEKVNAHLLTSNYFLHICDMTFNLFVTFIVLKKITQLNIVNPEKFAS